MKQVGIYEAKTHLSQIIDDVQNGGSFTITRHGVAVARIVPANRDALGQSDSLEALKAFNKGRKLGIPVREAIEEGRA